MESPIKGHWRIRSTFLSRKPRQGSIWPALYTVALILAASMIQWFDIGGWGDFLPANPAQVFGAHQYWRLFTTLGVHGDLAHFLGNMVFFIPFAYVLNGYFGYGIFPALSVGAGALVNFLTLQFYDKDTSLIGASGIVYFMVAFWLVLYIGIERRYSIGHRVMRCVGLVLAELAPQAFEPKVSYGSHLIGFALGISLGLIYFFTRKNYLRSFETATFEPAGELLNLDELAPYPSQSNEGW